MTIDPLLDQALALWIAALNTHDMALLPAVVARAVVPDVTVQRCGWGAHHGQVIQVIQGVEGVVQWLGLTAPVVQFALAPDTWTPQGPGTWQGRYVVSAPDDFVGGGQWTITVDPTGRLQTLRHQPDDLPSQDAQDQPENGHIHHDGCGHDH